MLVFLFLPPNQCSLFIMPYHRYAISSFEHDHSSFLALCALHLPRICWAAGKRSAPEVAPRALSAWCRFSRVTRLRQIGGPHHARRFFRAKGATTTEGDECHEHAGEGENRRLQ